MLVRPVAGVDDIRLNALGQKLRCPGSGMSDHDHVDPHRFEIAGGIDQRFSLGDARPAGRHIDGVGRKPLFGELEGDPSASRVLEEKIDYRRPSERRDLLDRPLADFLERLRCVENESNLVARQRLEAKEIFAECPRHAGDLGTITTSVRSSSSATITSTRWSSPTSTFLPTTSAWIGSSRPPRSIRTASEIDAGLPKSASSSSAARTVRPV